MDVEAMIPKLKTGGCVLIDLMRDSSFDRFKKRNDVEVSGLRNGNMCFDVVITRKKKPFDYTRYI